MPPQTPEAHIVEHWMRRFPALPRSIVITVLQAAPSTDTLTAMNKAARDYDAEQAAAAFSSAGIGAIHHGNANLIRFSSANYVDDDDDDDDNDDDDQAARRVQEHIEAQAKADRRAEEQAKLQRAKQQRVDTAARRARADADFFRADAAARQARALAEATREQERVRAETNTAAANASTRRQQIEEEREYARQLEDARQAEIGMLRELSAGGRKRLSDAQVWQRRFPTLPLGFVERTIALYEHGSLPRGADLLATLTRAVQQQDRDGALEMPPTLPGLTYGAHLLTPAGDGSYVANRIDTTGADEFVAMFPSIPKAEVVRVVNQVRERARNARRSASSSSSSTNNNNNYNNASSDDADVDEIVNQLISLNEELEALRVRSSIHTKNGSTKDETKDAFSSSSSPASAAAASAETTSAVEDTEVAFVTQANECVVCLSNPRNHACIPCGHRCLCADCAQSFIGSKISKIDTRCPVCRAQFQLVCQIYD